MSEFQPNASGLLVPVAKPDPPPPAPSDPPFKDHCEARTPEQIAFHDSLDPEFKKAFRRMMLPRGRASAGLAASGGVKYGEFLCRLYDVWLEYTGWEIEEWT